MTQLEELFLAELEVERALPEAVIVRLASLMYFDVTMNHLTGCIPEESSLNTSTFQAPPLTPSGTSRGTFSLKRRTKYVINMNLSFKFESYSSMWLGM
eukprot:5418997-Amphidinium_carterae.1